MNTKVENKDIKAVGDWLYNTLPPIELGKILKNKHSVIEPSSDIILDIKITLFELEAMQLYGHLPEGRNRFGIKERR
jgi:hypothetical protein